MKPQMMNPFSQTLKLSFQLVWKRKIDFLKTIFVFFLGVGVADILFWHNDGFKNKVILNYSTDVYLYLIYVVLMLGCFWYLYFTVAVIQYLKSVRSQTPSTVMQCFQDARRVFIDYLAVNILYFGQVCFWALFLIVPGIIRGINYSLSGVACVADGRRGFAALNDSEALVKKRFKDFSGIMAILFLLLALLHITIVEFIGTLTTFVPERLEFLLESIKYIQYTILLLLNIFWNSALFCVYEEMKK